MEPGDPAEFIAQTPPHKDGQSVKLEVEPGNAVQGMDSLLYTGKGDGFDVLCY